MRSCLTIASLSCLNESPSQKEGKSGFFFVGWLGLVASMKALPKRKGNSAQLTRITPSSRTASMKALPKRKGNAVYVSLNH